MRLLQTVNKEVIEIFDKELGNHGKRNSIWWLPIHLDKIQVRPGIEGHGVKNWGNTHEIEMLPSLSRPVRLTVRTPGFHPGNRGSIPLRASNVTGMLQFCYNCVTISVWLFTLWLNYGIMVI